MSILAFSQRDFAILEAQLVLSFQFDAPGTLLPNASLIYWDSVVFPAVDLTFTAPRRRCVAGVRDWILDIYRYLSFYMMLFDVIRFVTLEFPVLPWDLRSDCQEMRASSIEKSCAHKTWNLHLLYCAVLWQGTSKVSNMSQGSYVDGGACTWYRKSWFLYILMLWILCHYALSLVCACRSKLSQTKLHRFLSMDLKFEADTPIRRLYNQPRGAGVVFVEETWSPTPIWRQDRAVSACDALVSSVGVLGTLRMINTQL